MTTLAIAKDRLLKTIIEPTRAIVRGTSAFALRAPRGVRVVGGMVGALSFGLLVLSLSIGNVVVHQGYESFAMAKPAKVGRVIRQSQVVSFGDKVSTAFGIRNEVATEFADWILEASERQHIEPELLASLVLTESSFRKEARSNVGAIGPAQVRPDYWSGFCGTANLHDPEENIYCGAQVLAYLLDRCEGDRGCALAAYNVGPYSTRHNAAQRYVRKIDAHLASLNNTAL